MKYQYFIWRNKWYPNEVRLFRYEEFNEKAKVLQVFYGESYKRGKSNCQGICLVSRQTFLTNYYNPLSHENIKRTTEKLFNHYLKNTLKQLNIEV